MSIVKLTDIRANLITDYPNKKLVCLKDSPHYQFLLGDRQPYIDYLKKANQKEHSVENYEKLISNFKYRKLVKCAKVGNYYVIRDGFHRCCIMLFRGETEIKIRLVK